MKLLSILTTFSKIELNRLKKYILSPYFNKNKDIINLFYELERIVTAKRKKTYDKNKSWKKLFPNEDYNDVKFRKLHSDLLKLVEGFLAQEIYQENPIYQATNLLESIVKRDLKKLSNSALSSVSKLAEKQPYKPATHYYHQFQIEINKYEITGFDIKRSEASNVEAIINNLDYFYLAEKLKYYSEILSRSSVFTHKYELLFITEIIEHVTKYSYENIPPVAVYYQKCLVQLEPEKVEHFYKLKDLLNRYALLFPKDEANSIYTTATNYCIRKLNTGNENFAFEFLNLNEELLEKGIIGEGQLSPWRFKNVVTVALRAGRFEWTEDFIEKYHIKIPETYRENALTFNMAQLYYYRKQYGKVMDILQNLDYEDFTYAISSKTFLVVTYYELDEIEILYSLLDSFRVFLNRRKELSKDRKNRYLNFLRYVRKITNIIPRDKGAIQKIRNDVTVDLSVPAKSWLLEKIAELEK